MKIVAVILSLLVATAAHDAPLHDRKGDHHHHKHHPHEREPTKHHVRSTIQRAPDKTLREPTKNHVRSTIQRSPGKTPNAHERQLSPPTSRGGKMVCATENWGQDVLARSVTKEEIKEMKKKGYPIIKPGTEGFDADCKGGDSRMVCERNYNTGKYDKKEVSGEKYLLSLMGQSGFEPGTYGFDKDCIDQAGAYDDLMEPNGVTLCTLYADPYEDPVAIERPYCKLEFPKRRVSLFWNDPGRWGFDSMTPGGRVAFGDGVYAFVQNDCSLLYADGRVQEAHDHPCPGYEDLDKYLGPTNWECSGYVNGKAFCSNPGLHSSYIGSKKTGFERFEGKVEDDCCVTVYLEENNWRPSKECPEFDEDACKEEDGEDIDVLDPEVLMVTITGIDGKYIELPVDAAASVTEFIDMLAGHYGVDPANLEVAAQGDMMLHLGVPGFIGEYLSDPDMVMVSLIDDRGVDVGDDSIPTDDLIPDPSYSPVGDDNYVPPPTPSFGDDDVPGPPTPAVTGDPHFVMWSGHKYDFHGGCDLVLLKDPSFQNGQGLTIHIRTKIMRWWSYVDSAVVKIGEDTLEVMGGVINRRYFVNGKPGEKLHSSKLMPFTIGGHQVRYRGLNQHQFQFKIFLENDQSIVLKAVKDFMRVDIENPSKQDFGKSAGLMGSFEGGLMLGRDNHTVLSDPIAFGKEWQVHEDEPMLFHSVEGVQHPQECVMPDHSTETARRRLAGSIDREQAEIACANAPAEQMEDCIFDVMATNDVDMAGAF